MRAILVGLVGFLLPLLLLTLAAHLLEKELNRLFRREIGSVEFPPVDRRLLSPPGPVAAD